MTSVLWLRRDLRLHDLPALGEAHAAAGSGPSDGVLPLFVVDPALLAGAGTVRTAGLHEALAALSDAYDGALVLRVGRPVDVLPSVVREVGAGSVHVSADCAPYGRRRDAAVRTALAGLGVPLVETGSPYAVTPGRVLGGSGGPYQVFTPFSRAWRDHGWRRPAPVPTHLRWHRGVAGESVPAALGLGSAAPAPTGWPIGEDVAIAHWRGFLDDGLAGYRDLRNLPALDATSRLSAALKYGTVHPRTLLADVASHPEGRGPGATTFVTELAWREFYADVLWHRPASAWTDLRPELGALAYDDPATDPRAAAALEAWRTGRTGYPLVDAGMRQLLAEGWMHNRVRMVTASFLAKDLHVWWVHGARHFLAHLLDGDMASNSHGWQWTAGTGTDAAPYFRVFNPVLQGERFDPDGAYVRRWVPELAHLAGARAHQPWKVADGYSRGYPHPVVEHAAERDEALARYRAARTP